MNWLSAQGTLFTECIGPMAHKFLQALVMEDVELAALKLDDLSIISFSIFFLELFETNGALCCFSEDNTSKRKLPHYAHHICSMSIKV